MNTRLLIDFIVRQTTVLLGQLSTAAGIRAPLAHVADEVFLSLAREIEAQGVGRKVAADMFGLALRAYQKKVARLEGSRSVNDRTLWEAILDAVSERESMTRQELLRRFSLDGEREVIGVLTDLVGSGLVHVTGRGASAVYGPTTDAERRALVESDDEDSAAAVAWLSVRGMPGITVQELAAALRLRPEAVASAVERLVRDGRITRDGDGESAKLSARPLVVPVGAEMGWEAAVLDHFRAVANAIAAKVRTGQKRSSADDATGGLTVSFHVTREHPHRARVRELLPRVRAEVNELWNEVEAHNRAHPIAEPDLERIWFYSGQYVEESDRDEVAP
ncbi:MAG TPA: hypothetical protein VHE30_19605 [Polyangiaceae bacterium]|nr:hypothetical protein [Polyangiaceae bacterium]